MSEFDKVLEYGKILESISDQFAKNWETLCGKTQTPKDIYEESQVVNTKKYTWKDIVRINDKLYCEEFPISGEMDGPDTYCIGDFMKAVAEKHNCDTDDIETYMLDNIEFDPSGLPFGAEACGCYIDGVAEWLI